MSAKNRFRKLKWKEQALSEIYLLRAEKNFAVDSARDIMNKLRHSPFFVRWWAKYKQLI